MRTSGTTTLEIGSGHTGTRTGNLRPTVSCVAAMHASTTCLSKKQSGSSTGRSVADPITIPDCLTSVSKKKLLIGLHDPSRLHRDSLEKAFFAIQGDEVCGLGWCLLSDLEPQIAHNYAMWADPTIRRQGAGRVLLKQCVGAGVILTHRSDFNRR